MTVKTSALEWKKATNMPNDEFWGLVSKLGWQKGSDSTDVQKKFMKLVPTLGEAEAASNTFTKLQGWLSTRIDEWLKDTKSRIPVTDDGFMDLTAHIIGLGAASYKAVMEDPNLAVERAKKRDYTESFAYVFPGRGDYEAKENPEFFKAWAERNWNNYKNLMEIEAFRPIWPHGATVIVAMGMLKQGDVLGFLGYEEKVEKALQAIDTFMDIFHRQVAKFDTNVHAVKNLYNDVKESRS